MTYQQLHDGLSDMIEGGRLKEADIPEDYAWLVRALEALANPKPEDDRTQAIRKHAQATLAREGELEIDENALLSEGDDNGAYVQAWVWLPFAETPWDKETQDA
jgi:hypothetical protein